MTYIVADIGGTKMRIAASRDLSKLEEPIIIDTPENYKAAIGALVMAARDMAKGGVLEGVVAGLPVLLSPDKQTIIDATNLRDWEGHTFARDLEDALGARVIIENDTALVGLGEAVHGAGVGARVLVYVTVSTGVNAARIVDRRIDHENHGVSTGRQYVSMGEEPLPWESIISGAAIQKKYGKHPKSLGKDTPVWEELARITAFGIHNTILHWYPERVVLGGSMFNEIGIPVERVRYHLENIRTGYPQIPEILHSSLGALGGLWGGIARLKQTE
ncbi:ROK family protein [Candidatus Kaiserbacteria bacterium]|nr:ROK family protein [Candidatus Kaiserbacteria bacterium]